MLVLFSLTAAVATPSGCLAHHLGAQPLILVDWLLAYAKAWKANVPAPTGFVLMQSTGIKCE